jgi:UDP-GlcNAc3NAcA epimerase
MSKALQGQLLTVVGNRPQFIKMSPVSAAIQARGHREVVVHTGQHYDERLSDIFFRELNIAKPDIQLVTTARTHGAMTGELLTKIEEVLMELKPSGVLVYGDTNSTVAAALAAVKLHIPLAHIESGPRFGDLSTPEEVNRITTDHLSTIRFAPDKPSIANLEREGLGKNTYYTGDVMLDTFRLHAPRAAKEATLHNDPRLKAPFILMTLHRPYNVDSKESLLKLLAFIESANQTVLFPVHPRTRTRMNEFGLLEKFTAAKNLVLMEPIGYLDTVAALSQCSFVITDSGGLQKEAFFAGKMTLLMLHETPWPDLKQSGWQHVAGTLEQADIAAEAAKIANTKPPAKAPDFYGNGTAAKTIVEVLEKHAFFPVK